MAEITMPITMESKMPNTMTITIQNTMPSLFRSYITENTREQDPKSDSTIPSYTTMMSIDHCKQTAQSNTSNRCSLQSYLKLVAGGATTFKRGG
jgi:hypothetical protein